MYTQLLEPDQISHTQSTVAKRGLTNVHTPCEKVVYKTQHRRIPIDPAISDVIGHRFIAKKIKNFKMLTRGCEMMCVETQKPETFFFGLTVDWSFSLTPM